MKTVAVIVGSLRKESSNLKLARALEKLAADKLRFRYINIGDLPLFNQDLESDFPALAAAMKTEIESCDAVLFVTPEYNRSIPGVLKNAIDWGSRPYGASVWSGKPTAIAGTSPGAIGTGIAQAHLRSITSGFLDMPTMGQPELYLTFKDGMIDAQGHVSDERTEKFLQSYVDRFAGWIETHSAAGRKAA